MKITNTTTITRKIYRFPIPDSRFPIPDSFTLWLDDTNPQSGEEKPPNDKQRSPVG
ncbi:MAG: hypothetical protein F6K26_41680 [Moorea sp. SIO2I5]|nr:hypothetical protein [Moorena sp. SIO2I5]